MDLFEKINRAFGGWYEGLFGGADDVRPRDILRRILAALEEHRKEGFDNKTYVPNQYILEIAVNDEEEKEYLLSFLDRDELEAAIRRYCQQNNYHIRGTLDFTVKEVESAPGAPRREKVRVRCRYTPRGAAPAPAPPPSTPPREEPEELRTVYEAARPDERDAGTVPAVAAARLVVQPAGRPSFEVAVNAAVTLVGRSARAGNDVVLVDDGMVSRRHARIEMDADGEFTVYDLDTTNGTWVNGRRVTNRTLRDGDEIAVGGTRILFHRLVDAGANRPSGARQAVERGVAPRLVLTDGVEDVDDYLLGSETVIGRAITNDIVLSDRTVATRHARVVRGRPSTLEALDAEHETRLNGEQVVPGPSVPLRAGDCLTLGSLALRYEEPAG